jgi:MGT family glycosyltransferase
MRSYHLLFAVVGGEGHIHSALGIAGRLVRRGHRVTVVTAAGYADDVVATGARFALYRSAFDDFHVPEAMARDNAEELLNDVYIADNEAMLRAAERAAADDAPDAVVYDEFHFIAGKLLAAKLNRPGVRLSGIASNEHYSFWEDLRQSLGQRYPEEFEKTRREITALLSEARIDRPIRQFWDEIEDFNIVFVPRSFQIEGDTFDERFVFIGPSFTPERLELRWQPPDQDAPILLVSLGSTWNEHPDFFRACARAFEGTSWHVVLAIGEVLDPAELGDLPANVEARPWVSFLDVLRYASVFITQGTTGAVMASLYRGCPLLVFSDFAAEAQPTANRAIALRLGHRLSAEDLTAAGLRAAVTKLAADEEVSRRIEDIRRELRHSGGADRGASAIVEHLARNGAGLEVDGPGAPDQRAHQRSSSSALR